MAFGDDSRARNRIDYEKNLAQNNLDNLRTRTVEQAYPQFWNSYVDATNRQVGDYNRMMGGYDQFAKTGGFTPQGIAAIRSRSTAPIRGIYQNAQRNLARNRTLQGGYSPGYQASLSRLQRDTGQQMSDVTTNAEANIAQMVQQGKLAGLAGGSQLYGTQPGQVQTFGNQLLTNMGQQVDIENLQGRLGLGTMDAQIRAGQLPGRWEHAMGRIGDIANIGKAVINPWAK